MSDLSEQPEVESVQEVEVPVLEEPVPEEPSPAPAPVPEEPSPAPAPEEPVPAPAPALAPASAPKRATGIAGVLGTVRSAKVKLSIQY